MTLTWEGALVTLTILLPWFGAIAVWGIRRPALQHRLAVSIALLTAICALGLIPLVSDLNALNIVVGGFWGNLTFSTDALGVLLACIATVIGALTVIFSVDYMRGHSSADLGRYYALVLLFIGAMSGLVLTDHLMLLFFFWEMVALCSFALIAFDGDNPAAVAGGLRALVMTQIGGVGLLIGVLVAGTNLGDFRITTLIARAHDLSPDLMAIIAFGFLLAAAAKSAQFPFHSWLPGAMEAPTPVSALIHAATMVNAGVYLLARFYPALAGVAGWPEAVMLIGILSALIGGLMAIQANDLKRVLACSTFSQLGFMFFAVGSGAIFASQFHLLNHAIFKALLFLGAGAVIHALETRDMSNMGGLWREMPFVHLAFAIGALALVGVPIFNGFWSKELILEAALHNNLAFAALIICVALTALYAARSMWLVFYSAARHAHPIHPAPLAMRIALSALMIGTLTSWLLAESVNGRLASTLPFHDLHTLTLTEMFTEIGLSPVFPLAIMAIAFGVLCYVWRRFIRLPKSFGYIAFSGFGAEQANKLIVRGATVSAELSRRTQTGVLNWNVAGMIGGFILILLVLLGGAR